MRGKRVLIVEDNFLIAESLSTVLLEQGCLIEGPVRTADEACRIIAERALDGALLDLQLRESHGSDVAEFLRAKGVPFVLVTGYLAEHLKPDLREAPYISKPANEAQLVKIAVATFTRSDATRTG